MNKEDGDSLTITDEQRQKIMRHWEEFSDVEKSVLYLRFGLDGLSRSLRDTAQLSGISAERIREIEYKIINDLKNE